MGYSFVSDFDLHALSMRALEATQAVGATYCDIRISRHRNQYVATRENKVLSVEDNQSFGFGIRVIAKGAWGFAASTRVAPDEITRIAHAAVTMAEANAILQQEPVELAPTPTFQTRWATAIKIDPFDVPVEEKTELLLSINREALKARGTKFCSSMLYAANEQKFFASSEGSVIEQDIYRIYPSFSVTALSADGNDFESRGSLCAPMGRGYEWCQEYPLVAEARQAGEEAVEKLKAPSIEPGRRDLILMPSITWLVIHESIGHATELDRALGLEANFAGTSFVTPNHLGKLQYGAELVNVIGDRTEPGGLATVGFDDDGVQATQFDIIKNGKFVGYQTTREQARWIGDTVSHGCSYADNYAHVPMQRMPNVSLLPGETPLSPDELIADVEDGVLIQGMGSWSIDQQRRNFQFGGQLFHVIKNGKITGMLRDVAFQAMTLDFWNSCDAICSKEHYELGGSYYCGKAQPMQLAPVSHGSAPARFRNIDFINTKREV